jgi:hypothetical protein
MTQCKSLQIAHTGYTKTVSVYVYSPYSHHFARLTPCPLQQWLKSANTCPVCRGSVAETRPLGGGGRSVRTHSAFSGVSGAGRWRDMHSQTGPPPPGDNPGVSRFYHHVAAENINRMTRRRSRLAQLEQQVASASAASATAEGNSNAPPASSPTNNQGNGPLSSDSEDNQAELGFMHRFYGRR